MADQFTITPEFVDEWNRVRGKLDKLGGEGVSNTPSAITIASPSQVFADTPAAGVKLLRALITSQITAGPPNNCAGVYNAKLITGPCSWDGAHWIDWFGSAAGVAAIGTTLAAAENCYVWNLNEFGVTTAAPQVNFADPAHTVITGQQIYACNNKPVILTRTGPGSGVSFLVGLTKDGGSDGNAATGLQASWTYTVRYYSVTGPGVGQVIGTGVPVMPGRPYGASVTPASWGLAAWASNNYLTLIWTSESINGLL